MIFELLRVLKECDQALPVVTADGAPVGHVTLTFGEDGRFAYILTAEAPDGIAVDQARERLRALGHDFG